MIENQNMYIKADEYDTFCSVKVSANDENTKYFFANNTGTIYNGTPDVAFETMVWIENPKCAIHHGMIWEMRQDGNDVSIPNDSTVYMGYKTNGHKVYGMRRKVSYICSKSMANIFANNKGFVYLLSLNGFVYDTVNSKLVPASNLINIFADSDSGSISNFSWGGETGDRYPLGCYYNSEVYVDIIFYYGNE